MAEKVLSVFIDESGDFGAYEHHAPYYLVAMVLHDQSVDITADIQGMDERMKKLGYDHHAIHTGPLIRRESTYANDMVEDRKHLFNILYYFSRKLDFRYICTKIKKSECADEIILTAKLSKAIAEAIRSNAAFWEHFDRVIVQMADLVCTMELLAEKAERNSFSKCEHDFFGNPRDFRKNYLKNFLKKKL